MPEKEPLYFKEFRQHIDHKFELVDQKFDFINKRLDSIDQRFQAKNCFIGKRSFCLSY